MLVISHNSLITTSTRGQIKLHYELRYEAGITLARNLYQVFEANFNS